MINRLWRRLTEADLDDILGDLDWSRRTQRSIRRQMDRGDADITFGEIDAIKEGLPYRNEGTISERIPGAPTGYIALSVRMKPSGGYRQHQHSDCEELGFVATGSVMVNGRSLPAGSSYKIPAGERHHIKTGEGCLLFVMFRKIEKPTG